MLLAWTRKSNHAQLKYPYYKRGLLDSSTSLVYDVKLVGESQPGVTVKLTDPTLSIMSPPHLWHNQPTVILSSSDVLWRWKLDPHFCLCFLPYQNCQSLADAFHDSQSSPWAWCSKTSLKESFRRQAQRKLCLFKEFECQSFETSDKMGCSRANASTLRTTREDPLSASSSGTSAITRALGGCDIIFKVLSGTGYI